MLENHAADLSEKFSNRRSHYLVTAMLAGGLDERDVPEFSVCIEPTYISKPGGLDLGLVLFVLHENGHVLGNERLGLFVSMIRMIVGYDDGIHFQDLVHREGQLN